MGFESPGTLGPNDPAMLLVINSVGDQTFSTADLTTLLAPTSTTTTTTKPATTTTTSSSTQHYGPYPSMGADNTGSCGNNIWASDTLNRDFTVKLNPDGTFTVVAQFKNGTFTTVAGASPAACETYTQHGTAVNGGIAGKGEGYVVVPIGSTFTETNQSPYCTSDGGTGGTNDNCTIESFIDSHFSCTYHTDCFAGTFYIHYHSSDSTLIYSDRVYASHDRGGSSGDIANG